MRTGANGQVVVFWTQTELNGLEAAPLSDLFVGAAWSWRGPIQNQVSGQAVHETNQHYGRVELVNGAQRYVADLVFVEGETSPIMLFENGCPSRDQEFWISAVVQVPQNTARTGTDDTVVLFPAHQNPGADAAAVHGVAAE